MHHEFGIGLGAMDDHCTACDKNLAGHPKCSEAANEAANVVMTAHEENIQSLRVGTDQDANLQSRPAFKYILPQPTDRDSCMTVRLAKAVGQDSQCLFHPSHIRAAQILERGEKTRAEKNGGFNHV